jgi:capsular exopolysaccharide synthesis family protein
VTIDLWRLAKSGLRRWWLVLMGTALVAAAAYGLTSMKSPLYAASSGVMINPAQGSGNFDYQAILGSQSIAETYLQLVKSRAVLMDVIDELKLPYDVSALDSKVSAKLVSGTTLIRITASDPDPQRAADIANATANHFSDFATAQSLQLSNASRAAIDQQLADLKSQIDHLNQQITDFEQSPNTPDAAAQAQLESLRTTLNQTQGLYAQLLLTAQTMDLNTAATRTQVTVFENAVAPNAPYAPRVALWALIGGFLGFMLAGGLVVTLEYLDNTTKTMSDFVSIVGAPLLASIGVVPKLREGPDQVYMLTQPKSQYAEAIRFLRSNVEYAAGQRSMRIMVASANQGEGKSTVAANLAVAISQAGLSTVLIDADLRRPSQHRIFRIRNERGLSTLLSDPNINWKWAATANDATQKGFFVIPSGPLPPNPSDLLSGGRLDVLLQEVGAECEVIVIDTPPVLAVSDSLAIASNVDGVIFVCRDGKTRIDSLRRAAAILQPRASRILGIVVNRRSKRQEAGYFAGDYSSQEDAKHVESRAEQTVATGDVAWDPVASSRSH